MSLLYGVPYAFTKKGTRAMTVGLPGAGIGGVFYLLCALWMPFRELASALQRDEAPSRLRLVPP